MGGEIGTVPVSHGNPGVFKKPATAVSPTSRSVFALSARVGQVGEDQACAPFLFSVLYSQGKGSCVRLQPTQRG